MTQEDTQELTAKNTLVLKDCPETPHQVIYADQLSAIAAGPFTSRITIAIENHAVSQRVPVATIIMPTNGLFQLALEITKALSSREQKEFHKKLFEDFQKVLK